MSTKDERSPPLAHRVAAADGRVMQQWSAYFGWLSRRARALVVSGTLDPTALAAGASASSNIVVQGASPGQSVRATFAALAPGVTLHAAVTAANTVTLTFTNTTGGAVDLPQGLLRVRVEDMT